MFVNAYTSRGGHTNADPLLHASPTPPNPYSRTGATYIAVCGTQVRNITTVAWDPAGVGRRCRRCPRCTSQAT